MTIIAAVDRSERANAVVEEAAQVAEAFGDTVHVVHVVSESEFLDVERDSVEESGRPVNPERIREAAQRRAREIVDNFDADFEAVGLVGKVDRQIIRYADEHDAKYIVVAPRKRSPTGKALFGSVAQGVILNADCPVISIHA